MRQMLQKSMSQSSAAKMKLSLLTRAKPARRIPRTARKICVLPNTNTNLPSLTQKANLLPLWMRQRLSKTRRMLTLCRKTVQSATARQISRKTSFFLCRTTSTSSRCQNSCSKTACTLQFWYSSSSVLSLRRFLATETCFPSRISSPFWSSLPSACSTHSALQA